jgi:hypothetical protein
MAEVPPAAVKSFHRRATWAAVTIIYLALPNVYPHFMSPNEWSRLWLSRAILEQQSFRIDPYLRNPSPEKISDVSFFRGHFYSDKAVGMSLAAVPALALLRLLAPGASIQAMLFVARFFTVTLPALIALWVLLKACRSSIGVVALVGLYLGSVIFPQALGFTGHLPMTIAICIAAVLVGRMELTDARVALAGSLAGAAILIDFTSGIAAMGLLIMLAVRTKSIRKVILFGFCCAAIASVQLFVNARCFGGPLDFAYHHEFNPADQANRAGSFFGIGIPRLEAIRGLTFGRMQGMFVHSPFLLLAIPGVAFAIAPGKRDPVRLWAIAMCVAYFYLNSTLPDWMGGWSLGPRYLTLLYPLLAYLLVDWLECAAPPGPSRKVLQPLLLLGVTWSVLLHLAAMLTWSMPPHWNFLFFPVLELSAYLILRGAFAPNLLVWSGVPVILALDLLVLLALGVIILNGGRRSVPYVAVATLLFTIALSRAAPSYGSVTATQFERFLTYMGQSGTPTQRPTP